jgi:protein-tyrosine phosphatase
LYDLHAHILPELDDGATSEAVTLEMAAVAAQSGTRVLVATPHMKDVNELSSVDTATALRAEMAQKIKSDGTDLELVMGMENHVVPELPQMFRDGRALPINDTQYALIEMPFFGHSNYLEETLFEVQLLGITPLLAHPERIEVVQQRPEILTDFVEKGMLSQITAGSLLGYFGSNVKRFTEDLVRNELVHVIASDCHFPDGPRSPKLSAGLEAAAELVGKERASQMVNEVPRAIVEGRRFTVPEPGTVRPMRARPWLRWF